jgi:hypothetical protein
MFAGYAGSTIYLDKFVEARPEIVLLDLPYGIL